MIRILHYGLSTNCGGIENYLLKISQNIDRSSFSFDFIDDNFGQACFAESFEKMGFHVVKITPRKKSVFKNYFELKKIIKYGDYDIIHCHLNTLSYIFPIIIGLKENKKVIIHSRNAGASYRFITRFLHFFHKYLLKKNNKINRIAVSEKAGIWLFGEKNFKVFNNGINIQKFKFDIQKRCNFLEEFKKLNGKKIILNVGAFLYAKNHNFIIDVFDRIDKLFPNEYALILVGDGPLKKNIEEKIHKLNLDKKILLIGKRNDVPRIMMGCDTLFFPSLYEGFPNVVLEAQTTGLPCVISDSITSEVVLSDACQQVALNAGIEKWENALIKACNLNLTRESAYKLIEEKGFSVEDEIRRLENFYISLMRDETC